jgi:hypothetical protein
MLQEDLGILGGWFKLVEDTKSKYGVYDNDISHAIGSFQSLRTAGLITSLVLSG